MFRSLTTASVVLVALLLTAATAQEPKKEEPRLGSSSAGPASKKPKADAATKEPEKAFLPTQVEIHFLNDSNVRLTVQSAELEIETPYGKLAVPIRDIRAIDFGLHMPEGFPARIDRAVKDLDSADFRTRESAGKTLVDLGPYSYAAVNEVSRDKNPETSRRGKEILKKLQANHPKKDLKLDRDDKVVTPTFTIVGRILTPSIKVDAEYFGAAVLSLTKMRTLRNLAAAFREVTLTVDAARYGVAGQWLETDFQTRGSSSFVITARGTVDLMPLQAPGQNVVGPNGLQGARVGFGGGAAAGGGVAFVGKKGRGAMFAGVILPQSHGGMLFGKIGETGDIFPIGDHYEGSPENSGKLYLHIGPSPWGQSAGSYQVVISPKK
jgi:hypothetical protein